MIPAGIAIVLAIVVPWYTALYERDGWTHIASFFVGENLGRFSEGVGCRHGSRSAVLSRRALQRRLSLGADAVPSRGSVVAAAVAARRRRTPDPVAPLHLDPRDYRVLFVLRVQAGSLHLPGDAGDCGTGRSGHCGERSGGEMAWRPHRGAVRPCGRGHPLRLSAQRERLRARRHRAGGSGRDPRRPCGARPVG